jgi:integral membrane protein
LPDSTLRLFRIAAVLEAISWAGLLTGMFFKYVVVHNEIGVKVAGPIHGGLFLLYLLSVVLIRERREWDRRTTFLALGAGIPPFATVVFERWVLRRDAAVRPVDGLVASGADSAR